MIKSPTFYCNESKQSHLHNRDYYLPLPQEMEVSFLFSLTFKLAIHSYTKVNTTLSPKTAASPRSTWSVSRAASLLHSALGDKALLQEGCCIRLYLKAKHKKHQDSFQGLKSLSCLSPSIIWGLCLCKKSSFKANLLHSLFRREGEGEDPSRSSVLA